LVLVVLDGLNDLFGGLCGKFVFYRSLRKKIAEFAEKVIKQCP